MLRVICVLLGLGLIASLVALTYCRSAWFDEYATVRHPRSITPTTITTSNKTEDGVTWTATLALSQEGRLQQVQLDCNGHPYATLPVGADFPPNASGAYLHVYSGANCSKGDLELTIFTIPDKSQVAGIFIPAVYSFKDGRSLFRGVRRLQDAPLGSIAKYCPKEGP